MPQQRHGEAGRLEALGERRGIRELAAPALDLGLSGSSEFDPDDPGDPTIESDYKTTDVGLHLGMLAYF